ncbi:MAG: undecaprenyl-diphosphate phosphatase [Spirochaetia bacterium]
MNILQAIIFGAIQGFTEFLPVSSSGHLLVLKELFELQSVPILFDVLLHVSTLVVVLIVFRKRIIDILVSMFRFVRRESTEDDKGNLLLVPIILGATVLTAGIGLVIEYYEFGQNPTVASICFLITGLVLVLIHFTSGNREYKELKPRDAFITGIAQGFGVLPGISRSGITISAALFSGIDREKAGEFSFLLSIPAILGAAILKLKDFDELMAVMSPVNLLVGVIVSFIVGLFSVLLLLKLVKGGKLFFFSFYLIPLGIWGLVAL